MKYLPQTYVYPVMYAILIVLVASLLLPRGAVAECLEYRMIEYEDRVEVVCMGEQLTEAQNKAILEEEQRQEAETRRQRSEELRLLRSIAESNKEQPEAEAAAE